MEFRRIHLSSLARQRGSSTDARTDRSIEQLPKNATVYYRALDTDDWYLEYFAPGRRWLPLPKSGDNLQQLRDSAAGTVCLETTALKTVQEQSDPQQKWELVNAQHNVRLACWTKAP